MTYDEMVDSLLEDERVPEEYKDRLEKIGAKLDEGIVIGPGSMSYIKKVWNSLEVRPCGRVNDFGVCQWASKVFMEYRSSCKYHRDQQKCKGYKPEK